MFSLINPQKIKTKNTTLLQQSGIEVIDHLPYLDKPRFRSTEEIAKRCLVLQGLLMLHFEAPNSIVENWFSDHNLTESLNSEEKKILSTEYKNLAKQTKTDVYWYIEAIWAFTWVSGSHPNLTLNTCVEDTLSSFMPSIKDNESPNEFISEFKIFNKAKVFEILDMFYRAHWFARNIERNGKESDLVNLDVIIERRKALEFVCYKADDWEDISLDT